MFMISHKLAARFAAGCTDSEIAHPSAVMKGHVLWRLHGPPLRSNTICTPTCVHSATRVDWGISTVAHHQEFAHQIMEHVSMDASTTPFASLITRVLLDPGQFERILHAAFTALKR